MQPGVPVNSGGQGVQGGQGGHWSGWSEWSGWSSGQVAGVVRVRVSLDDMLSEKKIWFLCPKSSNN